MNALLLLLVPLLAVLAKEHTEIFYGTKNSGQVRTANDNVGVWYNLYGCAEMKGDPIGTLSLNCRQTSCLVGFNVHKTGSVFGSSPNFMANGTKELILEGKLMGGSAKYQGAEGTLFILNQPSSTGIPEKHAFVLTYTTTEPGVKKGRKRGW